MVYLPWVGLHGIHSRSTDSCLFYGIFLSCVSHLQSGWDWNGGSGWDAMHDLEGNKCIIVYENNNINIHMCNYIYIIYTLYIYINMYVYIYI